jgi:hypothetical protein
MAGTWIFVRGGETLEVRRWQRDEGGGLVIREGGRINERWFDDVGQLIEAQARLERYLRQSGWALQDFFPDRRTGYERRMTARPPDRRRPSG